MRPDFSSVPIVSKKFEVLLDGVAIELSPDYNSLNAIRCRLESLALSSQRILTAMRVDGRPVNLARPMSQRGAFCRIEAETIALRESSVLVLRRALEQTNHARDCVETALTLVLINDPPVARELWWNLASELKEPVLTLSLLPDDAYAPSHGGASLGQLRQWQFEQVAAIIRDTDEACRSDSTIQLSNALEKRVLPWLDSLIELIVLWQETVMAKARLGHR